MKHLKFWCHSLRWMGNLTLTCTIFSIFNFSRQRKTFQLAPQGKFLTCIPLFFVEINFLNTDRYPICQLFLLDLIKIFKNIPNWFQTVVVTMTALYYLTYVYTPCQSFNAVPSFLAQKRLKKIKIRHVLFGFIIYVQNTPKNGIIGANDNFGALWMAVDTYRYSVLTPLHQFGHKFVILIV